MPELPHGVMTEAQGGIPGRREIWQVNGRFYVVWAVPVRWSDSGIPTATVPVLYSATTTELANEFGWTDVAAHVDRTLSSEQLQAVGGVIVGTISDVNLNDDNPWDTWVSDMADTLELYPWMADPEIAALIAAARLEGRPLTDMELMTTGWWQSHSANERTWLMLNNADPATAAELMRDNRTNVANLLRESGVNNAPASLVNSIADAFTTGGWSKAYLQEQVALIADPQRPGDRNPVIAGLLAGMGEPLDTTRNREDRVRDLSQSWLGPRFGALDATQLAKWSGTLRNDPDGELVLTDWLKRQRMALFPEYADETLTYEDIASPWRQVMSQMWGETPDETQPFFTDIVRINNLTEARKRIIREGIKRGNGKVLDDLTSGIQRAFGTGVY